MKAHPIEIIEDIAQQSGTGSQKIKKQIVKDYLDVPEFVKSVTYALDPWKNFYTTTIPGLAQVASNARKHKRASLKGHSDMFDTRRVMSWKEQFVAMFQLLDDLSSRKLPPNSGASRAAILDWANASGTGAITVFQRILNKDLRCGMKAALFNKVKSGWVPEFKVQLAQPFDTNKLMFPCYVDPKFDGERCLAFITWDADSGGVSYMSRNGNAFANFNCFDNDLLTLFRGEGSVVVDGEVINRKGFQALMRVPKYYDPQFDTSQLRFVVFDILPQSAFEVSQFSDTQKQRYDRIANLFRNFNSNKVISCQTKIANNFAEVEDIFEHWVALGLEGIICKHIDGEYEFKRSNNWVKMKPVKSEDLEIVGVEMGRVGKKWEDKIGSLVVRRLDQSLGVIDIGVKSGLTDYDHENLSVVGDEILWKNPAGTMINVKGKTVEVSFDAVTEDGSLRFPRFKRRGASFFREDKQIDV